MTRLPRVDSLKALVAIVAAALFMFLVSLAVLSFRIDRQSAIHETRLVRSGYAAAIGDRLSQVESEAIWDALLQHTYGGVDAKWLETNVASPSDWDTFGAIVTVVGPDDRTAFAREQALALAPARSAAIEGALAPLIARLRVHEAATVEQRRHAGPTTITDRISLAATVVVQGRAYAALACRIDSATGDIARPRVRAPILAVLTAVDRRVLPAMAGNLLLTGARLTVGAAGPGAASISLDDVDGRSVASLSWTPMRPGTALLRGALPVIVVLIAMLAMAVALAYRRGTRSAFALAASETRAKHLAYHDQLTGLPNRRFLTERLAQAVVQAKRQAGSIALLLIDLDQFKAINDSYGHACGDELIEEVARRLTRVGGPNDVCARLGGDEFVILAAGYASQEAALLAERIASCIAEPIRLSAATVQVGSSIGVSIYPGCAGDQHELLRQADLALYCAKDSPSETILFYDAGMDEVLQNQIGLVADLRQALSDGSIHVAYQPQFCGGVMTGVEALARWHHPTRGAVSPGLFIPLAEQYGLIEALGLSILKQAFTDGRRWPGLSIAVNLSAVQIRIADFLPKLERLAAQTGARTRQFELEITESVLMTDNAGISQTLAALRAMGYRLALDDFGTGYSSLSYLRRFPIDKIKIDRSFVTPLPADTVAVSLVRAIVDLAQALDLDIIAEGVETSGQLDSLALIGCDAVQGYLTGRPVSADEIDVLLSGSRPQHWREPANWAACA